MNYNGLKFCFILSLADKLKGLFCLDPLTIYFDLNQSILVVHNAQLINPPVPYPLRTLDIYGCKI